MPRTPTPYETATGGKHPELTIFYNTAFFRVAGLLNHLQGKPTEQNKKELERTFGAWLAQAQENTIENKKILLKLKGYLWKGYNDDKNSSGTILEENDKVLIVQMLQKLSDIRNFHSHYYHINDVLAFDRNFQKHIQNLHDIASRQQTAKYPAEVTKYEIACKDNPLFDEGGRITKYGRTFFLSFFLTQGEMARFLSQREGYKRNDTPEFKIKHLVYRHYTHRDGAARHHYGQEENMLSTLPEKEQQEVLAFRSAVRITNYLNDVPENLADIDLFPFEFADGRAVTNAQTLIDFVQERNLFKLLDLEVLTKEKENKKRDVTDTIVFEQTLSIWLQNEPDFHFQISRFTFQKMVLLCINGFRTEAEIMEKLRFFVQERKHLLELLNGNEFDNDDNENNKLTLNQELDEYYRFKLRGNNFLKEKMGKWLEQIEKQKDPRKQLRAFKTEIENQAIELGFYDFFFEENEKPRPENQFMAFAVQYLMDSGAVKKWHWAFEKFEIEEKTKPTLQYGKPHTQTYAVNTRKLIYSQQVPTDCRLAFTPDKQIFLKIKTTEGKDVLFLLGHRAMKNLLIAHFDGKPINHFFDRIIQDLATADINQMKVLDANALPASYKQKHQHAQAPDLEALKVAGLKRMAGIVAELQDIKNKRLSRAEKNRQIMRCYLFFDWQYPQQEAFKFLRQDEYKRMSVYHYCLEKRKTRNDYDFLLEGIKQHMPDTIKDMVDKKAKNIDDLLALVIEKSCQKLEKWQRELPDYKVTKSREVLAKVGISSKQPPEWKDTIPFDIHPMLILRSYYAKELAKGGFSLSEKWWKNPEKQTSLRPELYGYQNYLANYLPQNKQKSTQRAIIGNFNELLTHDALLWRMAQFYWQSTNALYRDFLAKGSQQADWKVANLRQSDCYIEGKELKVKDEEERKKLEKIKIILKFYQLDDFLLVESKPVIIRVAQQLIRRFERGEYKTQKEMAIEQDPTGNYTIAYSEIFREMQRVYSQSLPWAKGILALEKTIIDANQHRIGTNRFIKLRDACNWANVPSDLLNLAVKVRNTVFHAEIPDGFTYQELEENPDLAKLLHYEKKEKKNYEIGL